MEKFTNETIDTDQLPKFEEVKFSVLHPNYWKVILVNFALFSIGFAIAVGLLYYFNNKMVLYFNILIIIVVLIVLMILLLLRIGYQKKGFAFRTHDVLFRYGIIATNTLIIPYNRVQHVALHEGIISRFFGLTTIQIFTAGGRSSDITIPGIAKEQGENIKQLLMGKIQKEL